MYHHADLGGIEQGRPKIKIHPGHHRDEMNYRSTVARAVVVHLSVRYIRGHKVVGVRKATGVRELARILRVLRLE